MGVHIRPVKPADIGAVTAIYRDAVLNGTATFELDPPDEAEMARRMEAVVGGGYPYVVAELDGVIVGSGYANAYRTRPAYGWCVEDSIYLDRAARGKGLGRAILDVLIEEAARAGFRCMVAVIGGSDHAASIRLHEAAGFRNAGVLRNVGFKHGRWLDTVMMDRMLGEGAASPPQPTGAERG
ncbi:MAG: GNAT family N-acetyltransferase [Alphaproteobacteria bacterium]